MDMNIQGKDCLDYAWKYFELHASQRLTTFHFYLIISTLIATGYLTVLKENLNWVAFVLGILLSFLSFIFWKLDHRNRQLIQGVENALKFIEKQFELKDDPEMPHKLRIFQYEEANTKASKQRFTYSTVLHSVFFVFGILGIVSSIYALSIH